MPILDCTMIVSPSIKIAIGVWITDVEESMETEPISKMHS